MSDERSPKRQRLEHLTLPITSVLSAEASTMDQETVGSEEAAPVIAFEDRPFISSIHEYVSAPTQYRLEDSLIFAPHTNDETALTFCVRMQNEQAVLGLIQQGADVNVPNLKDITPLAAAAHKGNLGIMTALLGAGAHVDGLNSLGSTALIQASHFGHEAAVELLLSHNAAADLTNSKGTTALMRASQEGHTEIARRLVDHGADVNRKNNEGMNALMLASQRGHENIVELLIKRGAFPDVQTAQGSTALMLACKREHTKVVKVLLSYGAEICVRDNRNRTAMDTAVRRMHVGLIPLLNTQCQVRMMQERINTERREVFTEIRVAYDNHTLQLNPDVVEAIKTLENLNLQRNRNPVSVVPNANLYASDQYVPSPECSPEQRYPDTRLWSWPLTLMKIVSMPPGVYEHIIDFIPAPRVWDDSLLRLPNRAKLSPQQCIQDVSVMLDEMLCDCRTFTDSQQTLLLLRLFRSQSAQSFLIHELNMPVSLVESLVQNFDLQSLSSRTSEADINFRFGAARSFISIALQLFRWIRANNSAVRLVESLAESQMDNGTPRCTDANMSRTSLSGGLPDGDEMITDAGNDEEEGDDEEGEDFMSIQS